MSTTGEDHEHNERRDSTRSIARGSDSTRPSRDQDSDKPLRSEAEGYVDGRVGGDRETVGSRDEASEEGQLDSNLIEVLDSALDEAGVPEEAQQTILQTISSLQMVSSSYSGPIPYPRMLADYEVILPGAADRILTMAEDNQRQEIRSRQESDEREMISTKAESFALRFIASTYAGAPYAFVVLTGVLAVMGKETEALASIAIAFITASAQIIDRLRRRNHDSSES